MIIKFHIFYALILNRLMRSRPHTFTQNTYIVLRFFESSFLHLQTKSYLIGAVDILQNPKFFSSQVKVGNFYSILFYF
jgi:hypothetical protein